MIARSFALRGVGQKDAVRPYELSGWALGCAGLLLQRPQVARVSEHEDGVAFLQAERRVEDVLDHGRAPDHAYHHRELRDLLHPLAYELRALEDGEAGDLLRPQLLREDHADHVLGRSRKRQQMADRDRGRDY